MVISESSRLTDDHRSPYVAAARGKFSDAFSCVQVRKHWRSNSLAA
jgi:hypothetical protein